jgi:lysophospholipase L1-like esterase
MRRIVICLSLMLLCLCPAAASAQDHNLATFFQHLQAGQKQTVVAYGTSVTKYGYWVQLMQDWFNEQYPGLVTVINNGGPGQNSDWGVAHLQDMVLDHHPDLVTIEFATNDAHERFNMPLERSHTNLDKIVKAIHAANPQTAIVLQTMNVFWDCPGAFARAESGRPQLHAFYEGYRVYAKEHALPIVDNEPGWQKVKDTDPETFHKQLPDGTHPNKFGNLAVNWPNVKAVLEQGQKEAKHS